MPQTAETPRRTRRLFKVTAEGGASYHGGHGQWPLPTRSVAGVWIPGAPRTVAGELIPCANGLHLCRPRDLLSWLGPVIWTVQVPDGVEERAESNKLVVRTARLERRIETWTDRTARHFACDCAERVLHLATDPRSADAIRIARQFADGLVPRAALDAARDAAGVAAWAAAWSAARAAAAGDAAWATAGATAWATAGAAARAAAWATAGDAAGEWQSRRLFHYLLGGQPGEPTRPEVNQWLFEEAP